MDFIERALKYLFWLLVVSWSVWLLKRALGWMFSQTAPVQADRYGYDSEASDAQGGLTARKLVRDPVCGLYIAEALAVPLRDGGELLHFCSTACRDQYAKSAQRLAANG